MEAIIKFERKRAGNNRNANPADKTGDDDDDESDRTSSKLPPNPSAVRHALLCAKTDDGSHSAECAKGSCTKCGSHGKFGSVFGTLLATTPASAEPDADLDDEDETIEESMSDDEDFEQTARQSPAAQARDKDSAAQQQAPVTGQGNASSSSTAVQSAPMHITYDQWKKRVYVTKDGRTLYKHDFVRVEVPLSEYWSDVYK